MNGIIAALLADLATVQTSEQRRWGYNRAAAAILKLEEPVQAYLQKDGTLRKIPHIGPSSGRVIHEVLATGASPTVEQAIEASSRHGAVEKSRALRAQFLTRSQVVAALREPSSGDVSLAADISYPDPTGHGDRKAVLVIRQNLDDDAKEAIIALQRNVDLTRDLG